MDGIVILNKPCGVSSNTACRKVGRLLGEKKVGHLGTLDPMAEGVLPVALGKCTKLFDYYLKKTKTYVAEFTFGYETDTLDREGEKLLDNGSVPSEEQIVAALKNFQGTISQLPPKYSAKKVNGQRAYDLARQNVNFDLQPKDITVYRYELLSKINECTYKFLIECSAGTYIRSLARDLAYSLDTYATMTALQRTKCGEFRIENSVTFDEVSEAAVISVAELFKENVVKIGRDECRAAYNTGYITTVANLDKLLYLVYCEQELAGVVAKHDERYKFIIRTMEFND